MMSHLYGAGSKEAGRLYEYSYGTSDEEDQESGGQISPVTSDKRFEKKPKKPKNQVSNRRNKTKKGTQEDIYPMKETNIRNDSSTRAASERVTSKTLKDSYCARKLTQSTADDPELHTDVHKQEKQGLTVCGRVLTCREISLGCICCSYLAIFLAGLLLGSLTWRLTEPQQTITADDFFGSPWVWPEGDLTVGAYYYPWYADDFHRGVGYLREQLLPQQVPMLGEYDDTDPVVINQHLKWSAQANVRLWVTSWWGEGSREDSTTKDVILPHPSMGDLKIALFYETTGRIKESEEFSTRNVIPDIVYICRNYFYHPNYFRIDGTPVLFVYLTRQLADMGILEHVVSLMREAARGEGYEIYIVGDHVFQQAPENALGRPPFAVLDAITNYDVYGSMEQPTPEATADDLHQHFKRAKQWKEVAAQHNCSFLPSVSPGYNDLGVRPEKHHGPLSRQLSGNDLPGSLFRTALQYARRLVEPRTGNIIMVNSFNEWHEDTQIEPAQGTSTSLPETLTHGIEYDGYGELYLNILRQETAPA